MPVASPGTPFRVSKDLEFVGPGSVGREVLTKGTIVHAMDPHRLTDPYWRLVGEGLEYAT